MPVSRVSSQVAVDDLQFVIRLSPITKKNSQRIVINKRTGTPMILPSAKYKQYEAECGWFVKGKDAKIDYPVNVRALYYMPTRRKVDLANLHEALHDVLVHYGVVSDDNSEIIAATDGSRVFVDKDSPRTEVLITRLKKGV